MWNLIITIAGFSTLKDFLEVLLMPITVALIAPMVTRRWQETERDLEIKKELIAEISELVMTTVMTIYLISPGNSQQIQNDSIQEELYRIYKKWKLDTCVIGSKLHAYFPDHEKGDTPIHIKWRDFSERVDHYYEAAKGKDHKDREDVLSHDKNSLFKGKEIVIEQILSSRVTGFCSDRIKT
jgi:hypothetical protein